MRPSVPARLNDVLSPLLRDLAGDVSRLAAVLGGAVLLEVFAARSVIRRRGAR